MANADLTADRLRELLDYNPETGEFRWKVKKKKFSTAGATAGWTDNQGRRCIEVDQRNYKAHRLAWLYVHGCWPEGVVDHLNGDSADNRIANLRDVTQHVNAQNRRAAKSGTVSGMLGACWDAERQKWMAIIGVGGKLKYLGRFDRPEDAQEAYLTAKRKLHEGCTI